MARKVIKRKKGTKKVITAKQKSARRKNIAVARSAKKKGGKKAPDKLSGVDRRWLKQQLGGSKNKRQTQRITTLLKRGHW